MEQQKAKKKNKGLVALWIVLAVIAVLVALLVPNRYTVRQLWCNLFAPTLPIDTSTEWSGGKTFEHVAYAEDSAAQYLDLYVPDVENPKLFVMVHGGGFIEGDSQTRQAQYMYRYFRDHGYACASVQYRLADEAAFPAACADVKAAVRYLCHNAEQYGFDASRVAIWGESAGGYLASFTALTAPNDYADVLCIGETEAERFEMPAFAALVDYYGVLDFGSFDQDFIDEGLLPLVVKIANYWASNRTGAYNSFEEYWLRCNRADWTDAEQNGANVIWHAANRENGNPGLKTLILHGDADITVSHRQSMHLSDTLTANGEAVTLRLMPGMKHADDRLYTDEVLASVDAFLQEAMQ